MTTSKWEELGQNEDSNSQDTNMDSRYNNVATVVDNVDNFIRNILIIYTYLNIFVIKKLF